MIENIIRVEKVPGEKKKKYFWLTTEKVWRRQAESPAGDGCLPVNTQGTNGARAHNSLLF